MATLGVIILNFNYARFVGEAIRSVLSQTDPFDEIVVVDDGSSDDSLAVIRAHQPAVRLIAQANAGQMRASAAGLAAIRTDYVYILDADDCAAEDLVATVRPHLGDRPVKVQFPVASISESGARLASVFPHFPRGYDAATMIRDNRRMGFYVAPPTAGNLYRRDFLAGLPLDRLGPNDPCDGVPSMIAPLYGAIVTIDRPLASYRVHGSGHSQWGRPTVPLLEREILWLQQRWAAVREIAPGTVDAPDVERTTYVAERRLMIAALAGKPVAGPVTRFLARLRDGGGTGATRAGLALWSLLILVPAPAARRRLVLARRSPEARPAVLNRAVVKLKRAWASRRLIARLGGS